MTSILILVLLVLAVVLLPGVRRGLRERRRERLRRQPFPPPWRDILLRNVPLYRRLPPALREQLHGHIQVFLAEKNFEGGGGLEITDEMRVTVAAQACLLQLNRPANYYPRLYSIIVYPDEYEVETAAHLSGRQYLEGSEVHLGESWKTGAVVLAWDHAKQSARDARDGHNLVFHEFAHQLDQEDGRSDGVPVLPRTSSYIAWARILGREYRDLQARSRAGMATLLDHYGAKNEAEFFAVATECFFERPLQMRYRHPELYEELREFYQQDPVSYEEPGPRSTAKNEP